MALFIAASSPANIQTLPTPIHAQDRALTHARLPSAFGSIAAAMPTAGANT